MKSCGTCFLRKAEPALKKGFASQVPVGFSSSFPVGSWFQVQIWFSKMQNRWSYEPRTGQGVPKSFILFYFIENVEKSILLSLSLYIIFLNLI